MFKPCMICSRIDKIAHPQLLNVPESLKLRCINELSDYTRNPHRPMHWILDYLEVSVHSSSGCRAHPTQSRCPGRCPLFHLRSAPHQHRESCLPLPPSGSGGFNTLIQFPSSFEVGTWNLRSDETDHQWLHRACQKSGCPHETVTPAYRLQVRGSA